MFGRGVIETVGGLGQCAISSSNVNLISSKNVTQVGNLPLKTTDAEAQKLVLSEADGMQRKILAPLAPLREPLSCNQECRS